MQFKKFNGSTWETVQHKIYGNGTDSLTAFPAVIQASGEPLTDYTIYGNTVQNGTPTPEAPADVVGCGVKTENLFDAATAYGTMYSGGVITGRPIDIFAIKNKVTADMIGKTYTISITPLKIPSKAYLSITVNGTEYWIGNKLNVNQRGSFQFAPVTENDLWRITYDTGAGDVSIYKDIMLNEGSTTLPYEPYGYKIPVTSGGVTTNLYLDAPLYTGDTLTYTDTGIALPTSDGDNIISFGTTVQPSWMSATFKGWHTVQAAKQYDGNDWS